jgi:hypothetical protein
MAIFGKTYGSELLIQRWGLTNNNCNSSFASEPLTLISTVGNTITVQDASSNQWINLYDKPLAAQPEWVPFVRSS